MKKIQILIAGVFLSKQVFGQQNIQNMNIGAQLWHYNGNKIVHQDTFSFEGNNSVLKKNDAIRKCEKKQCKSSIKDKEITYKFKLTHGSEKKARVALNFSFENWDVENYVIMPSGA